MSCAIMDLGAQQDPTWPEVQRMKEDTTKVLRLSDLCFGYRRKDPDSALYFGGRALELARKLHYPKGEAQALNDLAIIHLDRSAFAEADSALRAALRIRTRIGDEEGVGAVHNKLGNLYQSQLRLEEALEENRRALAIFERLGQRAKSAIILSNIAILEFNLGQNEEALKDHRTAAGVREALGDSVGLAISQGNMANVMLAIGDTAEALTMLQRAGSFFRGRDMELEYAVQANNEAGVRLERGEVQRAAALYAEALAIREEAGDRKAIASSLIGLADASARSGRMGEARRLALRGLGISAEVGAISEQMNAYRTLARIHARLGHADSTLAYHERFAALRDSVFSSENGRRISDLQARLGIERKEQELQQQRADINEKNLAIAELDQQAERRRYLLILVASGTGVVGLLALFLLQRQKRKAEALRNASVIAERELGLKALVHRTDAERKRIASELHDGVGQLLTGLKYRLQAVAGEDARLHAALTLADEAGKEVRGIAHSMMPRALEETGLVPAMTDMFTRSLNVPGLEHHFEHHGMDRRFDTGIETGIYRIAQEVVSNILKHAHARRVDVQLLVNQGAIVLIMEDDGVGFDPSRMEQGLGLRNLKDRARIMHGNIDLSAREGGGTVVTLRVPLSGSTAT
ncbi:MAG TPA: sensor histidine kinase [Flavobacteriales bacterium]|nr:sensor histidine kinase [Flavobacteriales bacterium]HNU57348.1 sensor histidine kinase [Flavobacteriales bacterium]